MNLPLHLGLLDSLEAGSIALILGVLVFAAVEHIGRRLHFTHGHTLSKIPTRWVRGWCWKWSVRLPESRWVGNRSVPDLGTTMPPTSEIMS